MTGAPDEQVERRLADLAQMGRLARGLVSKGQGAYLADGLDGETLRLAGRQLVIQVATVIEKLPETFTADHPDVEWVKIGRMRNLIAHHYDKVLDEFVWESLRRRIPDFTEKLGLGDG